MGFIRDYLSRRQLRREIKGMFGTYVSPALVEKIANSGKMPNLGGEDRELTAFFASIHSYATLAEQLPLAQLPGLMNEYFTTCTDAIQSEGGALDKYIGDAVVAMFGAPVHLPDHALRGCVAALKIQNEITRLREKLRHEEGKWPAVAHGLRVRIGLNTGTALIGNMGTATRFNYTMMGDNVNLAARMESGAKSWGVWTLCTDTTKLACEQAQPGRVVFRPLGLIVAKGRALPVELFEPVALREEATDELRECVSLFEGGLARYLAQDWDGAEVLFRRSLKLEPNQPDKTQGANRNPSLVFISHCDYMRAHPPDPSWAGVYVMKEK
jgi:adenylate cyclase